MKILFVDSDTSRLLRNISPFFPEHETFAAFDEPSARILAETNPDIDLIIVYQGNTRNPEEDILAIAQQIKARTRSSLLIAVLEGSAAERPSEEVSQELACYGVDCSFIDHTSSLVSLAERFRPN